MVTADGGGLLEVPISALATASRSSRSPERLRIETLQWRTHHRIDGWQQPLSGAAED